MRIILAVLITFKHFFMKKNILLLLLAVIGLGFSSFTHPTNQVVNQSRYNQTVQSHTNKAFTGCKFGQQMFFPVTSRPNFGPTAPFYFENYLSDPDVRIDLISGTYHNPAEIVGAGNSGQPATNPISGTFDYATVDGLDISLHSYSSEPNTYAHIYIDGTFYATKDISVGLVQHWVNISPSDAASYGLANGLQIYIDNTP